MENIKHPKKVICVLSDTKTPNASGYAINLAVALARVAKDKVLFVDMVRPCGYRLSPDTGIDFLKPERVKRENIDDAKKDYPYIVVNLSLGTDLVYELEGSFDSVHFFVESTKDSLSSAHRFLEALLEKGAGDIHEKIKIVVYRLNIFDRFSVEDMSWLLRRNAWALVPEAGTLEPLIDAEGLPIVLKSQGLVHSKAILQIAKREAGKLLGLALGSGAAFGLAHIGVLRVLEKNRIPIDIISASSIGALIASMWGLGFSSDKIEHIARKLRSRFNVMRLLDFSIPVSGILTGRRMKGFLRSILREKTFEDLKIPVKIMVYDLANRETLVIEKGLLVEAVYMSISVPGIFKPKTGQGRMIVDGGVSDPVPVDALLKHGVKKIIAVNVMPGPEDVHERNMALKKRIEGERNAMPSAPFYIKAQLYLKGLLRKVFTPNIFDVIMTSMQSMEYMLAENSCRKADITLRPVFADASSIDFHRVKHFVKRGEDEALANIEDIKNLIES